MRLARGLRFAVTVAAAIALAACGRAPEVAKSAPAAVAGAFTVRERTAQDYKTVSAILTNRDVGDARARIGGTLRRVLVREGDLVKKGRLLAVIVDQRLALESQAGIASVGAAEAAAERARADLARYQTLFDKGYVSASRMDALRADARAADAQLRAARAQAGAATSVSNEGRVLAPADGKVTRLPIPQGAIVLAGDVVVGVSTGARVLRIDLPEGDAGALKPGQDIQIVAEEAAASTPGRVVKVRQVYPSIQNGRVTADLDASSFEGSFIGARVRVLAPTGERRAIIVPSNYVVTRFGVDYVRLARGGGAIDAPIQLGARMPTADIANGVEVLSGLREGDQILPPRPGA